MKIKGTIVFEKNWSAIHEMAYHEYGRPLMVYDENKEEFVHQRKYKYIINEGSSRSSKTYSLIDCMDLYARSNMEKRMSAWRDTKKDCKDTIMADALKHFRKTGRMNIAMKHNKTESIISYETNSTFEFNGTDDEEKVHGYTCDVAWLNEPYKISKDTFDQIDQRTSDFIFIDWNPKKAHWIDDLKRNERAIVIKSTYKDNPFCPTDQRYKIESYQPISRCYLAEELKMTREQVLFYDYDNNPNNIENKHLIEAKRCIRNEEQRSADQFKWAVYGLGEKAEKPNRIFNWEMIEDSEFDKIDAKIYYGTDWGTVDPWAIVRAKYFDGCLYVDELNYDSENIIRASLKSQMLQEIDKDESDTNIGLVKWMFTKKLEVPKSSTIICDNNRPKKIEALMNIGYNAIPTIKKANSIVDGISLLQEVKVKFTKRSDNIREEQENYSWDTDRYNLTTENPEDANNHTIDTIRYIWHFLVSMGYAKI